MDTQLKNANNAFDVISSSNRLTASVARSILLSVAMGATIALSGCSDNEQTAEAPTSTVTEQVQQNTMDVKQPEPEVKEKPSLVEKVEIPEQATTAEPESKPVEAKQTQAAAVKNSEQQTPEIAPKAAQAVEDAQQMKTNIASKAETATTVAKVDGQQVYTTCASCHGAQAEGAMGPKLAGQPVAEIVDKLRRYKAGEQIGPLTGVMAPMAAPLSEEQMQAVAEYASAL